MKPTFLPTALLAASLSLTALAAEPAAAPAKPPAAARAQTLADASGKPAPTATPATEAPRATQPAGATATPPPAEEPATMLPQVEVNKSRITDIDVELQAQDQAIAREKVNTKPTKLDDTLNNSAIAKALSIFGGSSSEGRSALAQERIRMMEEEKELLESMRLARTKEEKAELQQELDALRATRRELDLAPK